MILILLFLTNAYGKSYLTYSEENKYFQYQRIEFEFGKNLLSTFYKNFQIKICS